MREAGRLLGEVLAHAVTLRRGLVKPGDIPATTGELTMVGGRVVWDSGVLHPAP